MPEHSEDFGKHQPNAGPSIAHDFGCTHDPCRCEDVVMVQKSVVGGLTANVKRWRGRASAERLKRQRWRKRALAAEAEVKRLRKVVRTALADLDEEHQPQWSSDEAAAKGKAPIGCALCWPGDGHWPCSSRLIADDLRAVLSGCSEVTGDD